MANIEPGWELYRSFLAVMREGSLSGAARALAMTQPSLGRHMRELESLLGAPLFTRTPQGLVPTELAHELEPHAQAMASASAVLRRVASAGHAELSGTVRVTASEVIGAEVLPPILTEFRERHPSIVVELVLSNQSADLLRRDADIAVRMVQPTQEALVARHVGKVELGMFAHRRYLDAHGYPQALNALGGHALIGFDTETPYIRRLRPAGLPYAREHFALRTDSDLAALAAIRAGFGIGIAQVNLARRDPLLVRLFPAELSLSLETWMVMHEDLRASLRVRRLFDHLATALEAYARS
ncbi:MULTISPECIES: LysR family transcriptional regulator [unclassified Dyella]|uniref:LysR family transcriptional regulator n=1 Tax=unclassified Dyella TaxID=2634549 RepID=UPI000C86647F|nr:MULTISPECIES: LysR family transcriptional regulator [unclassified Dyella]MDR3444311.1 LysR family transcriptional regulator [Dyella sp.]PMQ03942.1 HTH-type transcriptional regulator CysL [Dyella sp. AD56]